MGDKVDVLLQVFLFDDVDEAECGDIFSYLTLAFFDVVRVFADHGAAWIIQPVHPIPVQSSGFTQVVDAGGKLMGIFSIHYSRIKMLGTTLAIIFSSSISSVSPLMKYVLWLITGRNLLFGGNRWGCIGSGEGFRYRKI